MTADWQVFPTHPWNYALHEDVGNAAKEIEVVEAKVTSVPFSLRGAPVQLKVKARRVDDWRAEDGAANPLPESPIASNHPEETITLVPYAAAKLRITAFPHCKA